MEFTDDLSALFIWLGLFFAALFAAWPLGVLMTRSRHMACWPDRPMDNGEMKARWGNRFHQATSVTTPNQVRWPWIKSSLVLVTKETVFSDKPKEEMQNDQ
jgi:hypothetical protein